MDCPFYEDKLSKKAEHIKRTWLREVKNVSKAFPGRTAVTNSMGEAFTYSEVDSRCNQIANYIKQFIKESSNPVVAIYISRTNIEIVPLFLSILKLPAAVHLVEPKLGVTVNRERLSKIKPILLITDKLNSSVVDDLKDIDLMHYLVLEDHLESISKCNDILSWELKDNSRQNACVFSSSGTTGVPKTINMPLLPFTDLSVSAKEYLNVSSNSNVLQLAKRNFDAAVFELIISLGNGATLILSTDECSVSREKFFKLVETNSVTTLIITPSHINHLLSDVKTETKLETVMLVGEACNEELITRLAKTGVKRIVNGYGPSEAGIWCMYSVVYDKATPNDIIKPSLGQPIKGVDIRVMNLDPNGYLKPCSKGEKGELYVTNRMHNVYQDSKNNSLRYFYGPDLVSDNIECFYATGDIVSITENEDLVYVGRKDNQIKLAGQLVVTDEVANKLRETLNELFAEEQIQVYIGVAYDSDNRPSSLTAYHTARNKENASRIAQEGSSALKRILPNYMLPKRYAWVGEFKMKVGGKLDTQYIMETASDSLDPSGVRTPLKKDTEFKVAGIWAKILKMDKIWNREDKFSHLGGTSLLTVSMLNSIDEVFSVQLKVEDVINDDSLGKFADLIEEGLTHLKGSNAELISADEVDSCIPMRINSSCEQNLYLIHPGDGHIQVYQKMIAHLPEYLAIYAFRAPGSEEGEQVAWFSIEEYAKRYAASIVKLHYTDPKPIHLLGYCGGGPISIEIARALENEGISPATLTLLDIPNPYNNTENSDSAQWLTMFFNGIFGLDISPNKIRSQSEDFAIQYKILFAIALQKQMVNYADFEALKKILMDVKYDPLTKNKTLQTRLFFKSAFDLDISEELLNTLSTHDEQVKYVVKQGKTKKEFPEELSVNYFLRLLEMQSALIHSVETYSPTPLKLTSGSVMYLYASPNQYNPMPWYPNPDTWKEYLPDAQFLKCNADDHFSIVKEQSGIQNLLSVMIPFMNSAVFKNIENFAMENIPPSPSCPKITHRKFKRATSTLEPTKYSMFATTVITLKAVQKFKSKRKMSFNSMFY